EKAVDHVKTDSGTREDALRAFEEVSARELGLDPARIDALVVGRNAAREAKNFKEADRLRDELKAMGIELEDKKDGTTLWKVKRSAPPPSPSSRCGPSCRPTRRSSPKFSAPASTS